MTTLDLLARIVLAGILCGIIGIERQQRAKDAGFRTHILIGIGSALFMIASKYGFGDIAQIPQAVVDPSRIAAQVASGIGFLGAGSIVFQKNTVRGLTTATGFWVCAAIGLIIGSGLFLIGVSSTIFTLIVLEFFHWIGSKWMHYRNTLTITLDSSQVTTIFQQVAEHSLVIARYTLEDEFAGENKCKLLVELVSKNQYTAWKLFENLRALPGVYKLKVY